MFITIYVDNLLLFDIDIDTCINDVMQNLWDRFQITDLGNILYYLGMKVDVNLNKKTMTLWQSIYLKKILRQYEMSNYRLAKIFISLWIANSLIVYGDKAEKCIIA